MHKSLWILIRVLIVALFVSSFARMIATAPFLARDFGMLAFAPIGFLFSWWLSFRTMRTRFAKGGTKEVWLLSLWSSPLVSAPQRWFLMGIIAALSGILGLVLTLPPGTNYEFALIMVAAGCGILCGVFHLRGSLRKMPNQSTDPTLSSGTVRAVHDPRLP